MSEKKGSILIVEDDPDDVLLIEDFLCPTLFDTYEKTYVSTLAKAKESLRFNMPEVVILDMTLPDSYGFEGLETLLAEFPDANIVILTGLSSEEKAIEAVRLGASDYLVKGKIDSMLLEKTLSFSIERQRMRLRLMQAQKFEAMSQLAAGIAHNFTNKLTVLGIQLMKGRNQFGQVEGFEDWVKRIEDVNATLGSMNKQVMNFCHNQRKLEQIICLSDFLQSNLDVFDAVLGKAISLKLDVEKAAAISVDPNQLDQMFMNLLLNAKHAMKGSGEVRIQVFHPPCADGEDQQVAIKVEDDGCGISEENLQRVYEPFFTTKTDGEGTGLGLATVLGFVKQSCGDIIVDSVLGKGTKFTVLFPKADTKNKTPEKAG